MRAMQATEVRHASESGHAAVASGIVRIHADDCEQTVLMDARPRPLPIAAPSAPPSAPSSARSSQALLVGLALALAFLSGITTTLGLERWRAHGQTAREPREAISRGASLRLGDREEKATAPDPAPQAAASAPRRRARTAPIAATSAQASPSTSAPACATGETCPGAPASADILVRGLGDYR